MGNSAKAEQINVKEYIKERFKKVTQAVAETFAVLGDILVVSSDASKKTDAEIEAEEIWKANPKAEKAVKALEARKEIPEKVKIKTETEKRKPRYGIQVLKQEQEQVLKQEPVTKGKARDTKTQSKDDDYVK